MFIFLSSIHYLSFLLRVYKMAYKFESEVIDAIGELLKTEANYDIIYIGKKPDL